MQIFFLRAAHELLRFSVVSCATTVLRLLVSTALFYSFAWFREYYIAAVALGYLCQIVAESQANLRCTFKKLEGSRCKALMITLCIELLCLAIASLTVFVCVEALDMDFSWAQLCSIPLTGVLSYVLTSHCIHTHL